MSKEISRRDVLMGTAAAAMGLAVGKVEAAQGDDFPMSKPEIRRITDRRPRLGIIGCGGKGSSGMSLAAQHGDVVAICDVDVRERAKGMELHSRAVSFDDYRVMYEVMKGKIDAVIISTPDHHHTIASVLAMKQGIHCYCEKPLTRTIWEARQMASIARDNRVATQMGNQSTANTAMRKAAAAIRSGALGAVKEIHLWTDRAAVYWRQGIPRPPKKDVPKHLNFDLWLGPSAERDYGDGYHPFHWRGWWDFGTGALGDMGCHIFNMPFMALDLRDPLSVQAETSGHNKDSFPEWAIVHYEFGKRGDRGPVTLHWYDGGKRPPESLAPGFKFGGNGSIVVCEKGTVYSPNEGNTEFLVVGGGSLPDIKVDETPSHMTEFFDAIRTGKQAKSNFPYYAGPMTETVLLGNLAIWANGPKLEWDARSMRVKGTDEFDSLIRPKYRRGWSF